MKIAVYNNFEVGVVEGDLIYPIAAYMPAWLAQTPAQRINWLAEHPEFLDSLPDQHGSNSVSIASVQLRTCSPAPSHVFALPGNYKEHLGEIGAMTVSGKRTANEMGFFLKAPGSLVGAGDSIELLPGSTRRFDHECELAAVIGKRAFEVPAARAAKHVFGYACGIDVTMRIDPGNREEDRSMRKSFRTFTPMGPYLVTADDVGDPHTLAIQLSVNGEVRQHANTSLMIVNIWQAIEIISSVVELRPGDVILTGTPAGVGPLGVGDDVEIEIERVGSMRLRIVRRDSTPPRIF